jgi:3-hydroxyisobutyrate dehydrogenase-like beta-hydroxyacid dehydrogenase
MGRGFAHHLLAAGYTVRGFDVAPDRLTEFASWGGVPARSAAEAARGATWVITSLPKHEQVQDVLFGQDGVSDASHPGQMVIDTSTSLPEQARDLATRLAGTGLRFLDASVSGTGATVMRKDVVALVGGSDTDFHEAHALLHSFCRRAYHLGPVGSGALGKLIINVVVIGNRLALAEGLNFGMASGMNTEVLLQILKDGPTYSRAMDLKGEKMISGDYTPESTLTQSLAGTSLLLAQAQELGVPLFLTALYSQVAQTGVNLGFGPSDPAALIEALKAMSRKGP